MSGAGEYRDTPVRPYVLTDGRTRPADIRIGVDTLLRATPIDTPLAAEAAPQLRALLRLCRGGVLSVSEVASHLALQVSVVRILVGDLIDTGHLEAHAGSQTEPSIALLHEVLNGLRKQL